MANQPDPRRGQNQWADATLQEAITIRQHSNRCSACPVDYHFMVCCAFHAGKVQELASQPDLPKIAERPDIMLHVTGLLECLRASCLQPLLTLQRVYHQHEPIVCLLLKLAGDIVEAHVSYLSVSLQALITV